MQSWQEDIFVISWAEKGKGIEAGVSWLAGGSLPSPSCPSAPQPIVKMPQSMCYFPVCSRYLPRARSGRGHRPLA